MQPVEIVLLIVVALLIVAVIVVSCIYGRKKESYHKLQSYGGKDYSTIKPMRFAPGYLKPRGPANACANKNTPLYPLWDATVEYGGGTPPPGSRCMEFIQPP